MVATLVLCLWLWPGLALVKIRDARHGCFDISDMGEWFQRLVCTGSI